MCVCVMACVCVCAQNKLITLKENALGSADALDKDQQEAITKIKDVHVQLDLVKDLQKQFGSLQTEVCVCVCVCVCTCMQYAW